jgi:hypothetical protein
MFILFGLAWLGVLRRIDAAAERSANPPPVDEEPAPATA